MVKSYVKYEHSQTFGVVNSATSNVVWAPESTAARNTGAGHAYTAANEELLCWDLKKGELLSSWRDSSCSAEVTQIAQSKTDPDVFAVGHADGSIRVWDSRSSSLIISFNGHKSAITTLTFDDSGVRLASGSKDTDIIVWDLVAEVGLFKLRGHKDQITGLRFLHVGTGAGDEDEEAPDLADDGPVFLLSTSKDALIKIWDVNSQHCIETHVAQTNGECWSMGLSPDGNGCITAGNDGEIKVWTIDREGLRTLARQVGETADADFLSERGTLYRAGKDRTIGISFHPKMDYIAIHGSEKAVELWRIRSDDEVQKSLARKKRRRKEKLRELKEKGADVDMADVDDEDIATAGVGDIFVPYVIVRTGGKVRAVDWARGTAKALQLIVSTTNNLLEDYSVPTKERTKKASKDEPPEYSRSYSVELPGHRADVRSLALSSDDRMLASASNGSLKIWNIRTKQCLRTLECGYALCCAFLPGDKIVVVGTKTGEIELFDIASSQLVDTVQAHEGAIWSLDLHPDGKSVVSGSADKTAKFWNFEIVQEEIPGTKRTTPKLKLAHARTLKVNDDILSLRFSPDSRLLAVATLDNTVKVFFVDSLKLFLNLYGHKLPVLSMSISSDSKLIATCSADKNVRLWGLDFGDCHKAFFAHTDSIMQVSFIPHPVSKDENHHFFSASKDRTLKTWDGDKFEQIQKLEGHHGEIWAMVVSRTGDFVVTASHDKSMRVWNQSDEPIFLEEERERELEELYESTLAANLDGDGDNDDKDAEVGAATKQTIATLTAGERIMEALELGLADLEVVAAWRAQKAANPTANMAPPQRDPLFMALGGISAERHVLNTVAKIPASQLHDALLVLPFSTVPGLFTFIRIWVQRQWSVPLVCRVLFFMLRTHQRQIVASKELKTTLEGMREDLRNTLGGLKDMMGFNAAALKFVGARAESGKVVRVEDVEEVVERGAKGKKKRAFVDVA
ncbi:WD repeat-containing protein 3 [Lasiodiplodia hormozganensis]|uniref:WD repeat-containing protein 3 n=1 Tax=Lasiodiplodia hormozganensis TaxID=869390 RepID=A0AA39YKQ7_9PEZI|nr:WD repeat-containing protein 3 [Lasiodiplodia hormozganensis]